jgi:ATP-dependent Lon protease
MCSVNFHGKECSLEESLDETVRSLQSHLNAVQMNLRTLAADQERDPDFKESIAEADKLEENIVRMIELFDELKQYCYDLCGIPDSMEEKVWLKQHKIERREFFKRMAIDTKERIKKEKEEYKNNKENTMND